MHNLLFRLYGVLARLAQLFSLSESVQIYPPASASSGIEPADPDHNREVQLRSRKGWKGGLALELPLAN
ncbi:unnamed protein product [Protopolystoma xenopodis]|uniref:Uncharacterized protein n=1 Tax=Protopolystoma xenopodis TaxID=117903 RepID=A0A448X6K6_9PLAT|nr:unnamed protein product [Protopolystoma xenopodis]